MELSNLDHAAVGDNNIMHDHPSTPDRQRLASLNRAEPAPRVNHQTLQTWWSNTICPTITHDPNGDHSHNNDPRDYLALERTHLAHVRTASALASFGIALTQLFRLKNVDSSAGIVLGAVSAGGGAVIVLAGAVRYFQQQQNLLRGKAVAGGSFAWIDGIVLLGIIMAVLVVVIAED
ncbi:MAG: hypothetical protein LQ338_006517 [Usnochroma carphineum]|nr:MAG: hypothetical protein LQ338_006517 [Usnochroma carphineum]